MLSLTNKSMFNATMGEALMSKTYEATYQWPSDRSMPQRMTVMIDLDSINNLAAHMTILSKQLGKLNVNSI